MGIISLVKANNLLWLGRYSERVYTTIRKFYIEFDKMIDNETDGYSDYCNKLNIPIIYQSNDNFINRYLYDKTNPDLFEKQYIPEWEAKRDRALERFRNFVVSIYDKLHVVGNKVDRKEGKMIGNVVAEIKDVDGKGHDVNYPNLREDDKLYKNATKAAITAMDKDPTIVDCDLKNHKGNQKRPLIHAKRSKAKNLKQHRALCKAA